MKLNQLISTLSRLQRNLPVDADVYVCVDGSPIEFLDVADVDSNKQLLEEYGLDPDASAVVLITESIADLGYEMVVQDDSIGEVEYGYGEEEL